MVRVPTYKQLMNPTLKALQELGGSGTVEEIYVKVTELVDLSDNQLNLLHNPERGTQTEVEYRLAWARSYLKKYGLIDNSKRGVWALTPEGRRQPTVDPDAVRRYWQQQYKAESVNNEEPEESGLTSTWQDELMESLLQLAPDAFERLIQRLLRESGFIQVEVTGRSGDGGVDGKGIMRLGGLLSFHVIFQCKRYQGAVGAAHVRDFRGAMVGRADKALLITTGNFTKDAVREATRDGAPAIDLIDGELLIEKLYDLDLGVSKEFVQVEKVVVDKEWFSNI